MTFEKEAFRGGQTHSPLGIKQRRQLLEMIRLIPIRPHIHPRHFRALDHPPQRIHQGPVDPHELLLVDLVGFVEDHPDFLVVVSDGLDRGFEFVGYVEFVGVKEEDDHVCSLVKKQGELMA